MANATHIYLEQVHICYINSNKRAKWCNCKVEMFHKWLPENLAHIMTKKPPLPMYLDLACLETEIDKSKHQNDNRYFLGHQSPCSFFDFAQVDVETEGLPVVDSFWLVQHHHGPFTNLF